MTTPTNTEAKSIKDRFFPFKLKAFEASYGVESPREFRETFLASRPKDMSWYGYDVEVLSQTKVRFFVFDMYSFASGGIGEEIGSFDVSVDEFVTANCIQRRALKFAERRRQEELEAQEEAIIQGYAKEILENVMSKETT